MRGMRECLPLLDVIDEEVVAVNGLCRNAAIEEACLMVLTGALQIDGQDLVHPAHFQHLWTVVSEGMDHSERWRREREEDKCMSRER